MTDFMTRLATLKRPRLLIRAARFGLADYSRDRDLKRLLGAPAPPPQRALDALLSQEAQLEEARRAGAMTYSAARHVAVLIAVLSEARMMPGPTAPGACQ